MIGLDNSDYYRRRARQAEALAASATMPEVRAIHRDMAARYAALAEHGDQPAGRPMLKLAY